MSEPDARSTREAEMQRFVDAIDEAMGTLERHWQDRRDAVIRARKEEERLRGEAERAVREAIEAGVPVDRVIDHAPEAAERVLRRWFRDTSKAVTAARENRDARLGSDGYSYGYGWPC